MPTIRNVNPIGDVEVPLLRRIVARGETVDVTDDQAERLLPQEMNWQLVKPAKPAKGGDSE
jgi:hypothetical protein